MLTETILADKLKQRKKTPLCRPRFTEKSEQQAVVKSKSRTNPKETLTTKAELVEKLRKSKVMTGGITINMRERFKAFPWAQDTMLTASGMDVILMDYLEENMGMDGAVLTQ